MQETNKPKKQFVHILSDLVRKPTRVISDEPGLTTVVKKEATEDMETSEISVKIEPEDYFEAEDSKTWAAGLVDSEENG